MAATRIAVLTRCVVLVSLAATAASLQFLSGPSSALAPAGGAAELRCTVDLYTASGSVTVYWFKARDGGGVYITGGSQVYTSFSGHERYSVSSSSMSGVYSYVLRIADLQTTDSGQYQCVGIDSRGSMRSELASLGVLAEAGREPLSCNFYPESPGVGDAVTFSCLSPAGVPPEMLSWWIQGGLRVQPSAHLSSSNRGISFVKTLDSADNFAAFTCLLGTEYRPAGGGLNCSVTPLAVPTLAVVTPAVGLGSVAGSATFTCRGTAVPPVTRYRWILGTGADQVKISGTRRRFTVSEGADSSTLTIGELTMADDGKAVRCVVLNDETKNIGSAELRVTVQTVTERAVAPVTDAGGAGTSATDPAPIVTGSRPAVTGRTPVQNEPGQANSGPASANTPDTGRGDFVDRSGCGEECADRASPKQAAGGSSGGDYAVVAVLSVLSLCAVVLAVAAYLVHRRRRANAGGRVAKREKKPSRPLKRLSRSGKATLHRSETDLVRPDSVRLKTIEVIVNEPPPEWHLRVKDVVAQDGDAPAPDGDVKPTPLYAKVDRAAKQRAGAPSGGDHHDVYFLSAEAETTDDCFPDGVSDASTWDMSSVDSGCEHEAEEEEEEELQDGAVDPVTFDRQEESTYAELDLAPPSQNGDAVTTHDDPESTEYANIVGCVDTPPSS